MLLSLIVGGRDLRDVLLKVAGGMLVLLESYYAARTLKENRADKRADQILKAIELTANQCRAVHGGAAHLLLILAEDIKKSSGGLETDRVEAISFVFERLREQYPDDPFWSELTKRRIQAIRGDALAGEAQPDATRGETDVG